MSKINLENCPCCGGKALIERHRTDLDDTSGFGFGFGVFCTNCYLQTYPFFPSEAAAAQAWNRRTTVSTALFDKEEIHENCTVQILKNSVTGEESIGWWENDKEPSKGDHNAD